MTRQYLDAAQIILDQGTRKPNRTGIDTISTFAVPMRFDLREGFPLLTTKKINWFHIVAENLWFLSGEPHIGFLKKHNIKFWDAWADEQGNVPSAYGNFWRHFPLPDLPSHEQVWMNGKDPGSRRQYNDQIAWALGELRKNPASRRLVVSAWAPGNAQTSRLPPCHTMFALNTQNLHPIAVSARDLKTGERVPFEPREFRDEPTHPHLCLHLTQRSCDMFLGVPYNIAGYAFVLSVMAHLAGLEPGIFSHMLVDAHFYTRPADWKPGDLISRGGTHGESSDESLDHVPQIRQQLERTPRPLPKLVIDPSIKELDDLTRLLEAPKDEILDVFKLEGYNPHPPLKGAVAV